MHRYPAAEIKQMFDMHKARTKTAQHFELSRLLYEWIEYYRIIFTVTRCEAVHGFMSGYFFGHASILLDHKNRLKARL